jgi:hypothetical protein
MEGAIYAASVLIVHGDVDRGRVACTTNYGDRTVLSNPARPGESNGSNVGPTLHITLKIDNVGDPTGTSPRDALTACRPRMRLPLSSTTADSSVGPSLFGHASAASAASLASSSVETFSVCEASVMKHPLVRILRAHLKFVLIPRQACPHASFGSRDRVGVSLGCRASQRSR